VDVLYHALKQEGVTVAEEPKADVYIISGQPDDVVNRQQLAAPLRAAGFSVAIDYSTRTLERQRESAIKHGAKVLIVAGTPESRGGYVIVRDLRTKDERKTRLAAVVTEVKRHVPPRPIPALLQPPPAPDVKGPGAPGETPPGPEDRN
jgi:histidyl-tRNA synthetase